MYGLKMMDLDLQTEFDVKLEPDSPDCQSPGSLSNGFARPLSDFNSDSDCGFGKTYRCEGGDLSCGGSSPDSLENKHEFCSSTQLGSDHEGTEGPKRLCLVCGDIASGYHYGVASCEACKAFFKRTIQGNIEYSCPANGNCEITKRRRKACQACRFQKCLRMGMLKEGVRLDRVRGGRQKYKRSPEQPQVAITQSPPVKKQCIESSRTPINLSDSKLLEALLRIEPEKVYAMPDPNLPDDDYKLMATLSDLADRELVATIGWAKQVPGFINLALGDQMNLLQSTWLDVLCLNLAYRSVPYNGVLVFADDFQCTEEDSRRFESPPDLDSLSRKMARKLSELKITNEEYVLLKAMLLLNPDANLDNPEAVQTMRDRMQDALIEYEKTRTSSYVRRTCNLLLSLPILMHEKLLAKDYWFNVKKGGRVPLHKLLSEMLEYAVCT